MTGMNIDSFTILNHSGDMLQKLLNLLVRGASAKWQWEDIDLNLSVQALTRFKKKIVIRKVSLQIVGIGEINKPGDPQTQQISEQIGIHTNIYGDWIGPSPDLIRYKFCEALYRNFGCKDFRRSG